MTGELGIDETDRMVFACEAMSEAGLRTRLGKEPMPIGFCAVKCEPIDATEIICVIENFYDVEFSQADHDALYALTKRGELRVDELATWLGDCEERRNSK